MVDALDLFRCSVCGTFYAPESTPVSIRANAVVGYRLTDVVGVLFTDVVGVLLTGSLLDMEV